MPLIPDALKAQMLDAADLAGSVRVEARVGWLREVLDFSESPFTPRGIEAGYKLAKLRCSPPPCVELWVVENDAILTDWTVA